MAAMLLVLISILLGIGMAAIGTISSTNSAKTIATPFTSEGDAFAPPKQEGTGSNVCTYSGSQFSELALGKCPQQNSEGDSLLEQRPFSTNPP